MGAKQTAYRGFDASFQFDLSDSSVGIDSLVGKTSLFTVKSDRKAADDTAALAKDFVISSDDLDSDNPLLLIISFSAEEMIGINEGTFYFDLKLFNEDGTGLLYVPYEAIDIIDDVTDRIAIS